VGLEEILKKVAGKCVKDEKGGEIAKDVFFRLEFEPQEYIFKQSKLCFFFQKYFNNHFCRRS
jgi:hypothetical protein